MQASDSDETSRRVGDPRLDQFYRDVGRTRSLRKALRAAGFDDVTSFVQSHPDQTYIELADGRFGLAVIPMMLIEEHAIEAVDKGRVRQLAMEMIVRFIREELPLGWHHQRGLELDSGTAGPLASLLCALKAARAYEHDYKLAENAWRTLVEISPPIDWLPKNINDPFIQHAFANAWPIADD